MVSDSGAFRRAMELLQNRNIEPAISLFYQAQESGFDSRECAAARWKCWMLLGKFETAWQESDFISKAGEFWTGEPWHNKQVVLRCLHGLGDTIQFIRYSTLLRQTCRSLAVQVHPELVRLVKHVQGVDHAFTWGAVQEADPFPWDMQMEVTELPRAFRTTLHTIPADIPYIQLPARPTRVRQALRIGTSWQASTYDPTRSIESKDFTVLYNQKGCEFHSLQLDQLADLVTDVQDTAALMLDLDLIITVDTMTAHLAGALGRPVWILLPFAADWRWMMDRTDSPWYPTARLFRQPRPGDWRSVIEEVVNALNESFLSCDSYSPSKDSFPACKES